MFKKSLIIATILLLLSGCSLGGKDYDTLSRKAMKHIFDVARYTNDHSLMGMGGIAEGKLHTALDVPGAGSGDLAFDYRVLRDAGNFDFSAKNLLLAYTTLGADGLLKSDSLKMDNFSVRSLKGDLYFLVQGIKDTNLVDSTSLLVIEKYKNTWLSITQADLEKNAMNSLSEEEKAMQMISKNLAALTLDDIEKYATDYSVLKAVGNAKEENGKITYQISWDKDGATKLFDDLMKRLSGSGISDEQKSALAQITFSGSRTFDIKNPEYNTLIGEFQSTPNGEKISLTSKIEKNLLTLDFKNPESGFNIMWNKPSDNESQLKFTLTQNNTETASANFTFTTDSDAKKLVATLSSQGMSVTLRHTRDAHSFYGSLEAPLGNTITWKGTSSDDSIDSLVLTGRVTDTPILMSLVKQGDMVRGPLMVGSSGAILLHADVGIRSEKHRSTLELSIDSPDAPNRKSRLLFDVTHNWKEDKSVRIEMPNPIITFDAFLSELQAAMPSLPEMPIDSVMLSSGISSTGNVKLPLPVMKKLQ